MKQQLVLGGAPSGKSRLIDEAGRLYQELPQPCSRATLVSTGIPQPLK